MNLISLRQAQEITTKKSDRLDYSFERAPWALVIEAEPLKTEIYGVFLISFSIFYS